MNYAYKTGSRNIIAIQYTGKNPTDIHEFCGAAIREPVLGADDQPYMELTVSDGTMRILPGDYILKRNKDSKVHYVLCAEIFEKAYKKVSIGKETDDNTNKLEIIQYSRPKCYVCKNHLKCKAAIHYKFLYASIEEAFEHIPEDIQSEYIKVEQDCHQFEKEETSSCKK